MPARPLALLAMVLLLSGCALPALDLVTPRAGYSVERDIAYGPEPRQRLDHYQPESARPGAPLVVFFYGGSWESGYKGGYRFVAQALAAAGYSVVVPDYRLYPEVRFPAFVDDGALAVAQTLKRVDGDRELVLMGHSAGAHIAALLALDDAYLARAGVSRDRVRAWIGLSGPYDFLPLTDPDLIDTFGAADGIPETQPVTHAGAGDPPALLIYGMADRVVGPQNHRHLARALDAAGVPVAVRTYPGVSHNDTLAAFSVRLRGRSPAFGDTLNYLEGLAQ